MAQNNLPIVFDAGTGYIKIGFGGDNFPMYSIPAILGRPMLRYNQKIDDIELKEIMVGDEAAPYQAMLELSKPVEEGIVKNWDDMEIIWDYCFKKVKQNTQGSTILMTEAVLNPDENKKNMAELLFEKFQFGRMQIGIQALLSLYAEGLQTGILLDAGDGVTHCIPVYENFILGHLVQRMNIAGRHLTQYLVKLLFRRYIYIKKYIYKQITYRGYAFNSTADFEQIRTLKEKLCYVSGDLDVDRELANETTCLEKEYKFPDGTSIKIGRERFEAPELLFNPCFDGHSFGGVHNMVFDVIQKCEIDLRSKMYQNILISGGTTTFPGFPTRLQNEVIKLYKKEILKNKSYKDSKIKVKVIDPPNRMYNVFIGGAVLAKIMQNQDRFWVSKQDYDEIGKDRIISKFQSSSLYF
ncbi:hypothetical protein IMG5_000770 [Ichthyophthirius multifiliis]|uniref:Actin, cytoplasmic n=1 Tax=Ichthyophthirius multifiliis TaxID=5932 RepID=G0QIW4_ICHMU|nr:hypothetical protein IMG5_000770 [Ichthyophthirius multifiliis]EGR34849.1 hypothetical protein IMG5_000770 [Ichthyophthirius multifiliis]|eukprot:XP_004040153.1 hypothetical protein IMG5_000770 [Ichthyophthirius multifiliis]